MQPLVIGHRGACAHAAENSLASAALAHAQGADLIELDVILSRDGQLVVCHDLHLDELTDVAVRFPGRARADGLTYVLDLDGSELRQLRTGPRKDGPPRTFPTQPLATLDAHLDQLAALNAARAHTAPGSRPVELYLELKSPAWHAAAGRDLTTAALACLTRHGLSRTTDPVIVETFDPAELRRLRFDLKTNLRLTQLLGENAWAEAHCDYDTLRTPAGLREIATYAQAVAINLDRVLAGVCSDSRSPSATPQFTSFVADAHAAGLRAHAYTFRADALPHGQTDAARVLHWLLDDAQAGLDGLFTDHPDVMRAFLGSKR